MSYIVPGPVFVGALKQYSLNTAIQRPEAQNLFSNVNLFPVGASLGAACTLASIMPIRLRPTALNGNNYSAQLPCLWLLIYGPLHA
jgi:hypothetical protein